MPFWLIRKSLIGRGYWDEANADGGDGGGGSAGGADKGDTGNDKDNKDTSNKDDKDKGNHKPSDEEAKLLKEVMEKKKALKEKEDALAAAQQELKKFEGLDIDAIKGLLKEKEDAEKAQLEAKGEWDRLKEMMADSHRKELEERDALITQLKEEQGKRESTIHALTIGNAFSTSKYIGEELTLPPNKAKALYGEHFEFKDGQVVGYDKPKGSSERTMLVGSNGSPLPFDEAMAKIINSDPEKESLIRSKMKPGSGSGGTRADAGKPPDNSQNLSPREKMAQGLKEFGF